jgi:hypothetical protein
VGSTSITLNSSIKTIMPEIYPTQHRNTSATFWAIYF